MWIEFDNQLVNLDNVVGIQPIERTTRENQKKYSIEIYGIRNNYIEDFGFDLAKAQARYEEIKKVLVTPVFTKEELENIKYMAEFNLRNDVAMTPDYFKSLQQIIKKSKGE